METLQWVAGYGEEKAAMGVMDPLALVQVLLLTSYVLLTSSLGFFLHRDTGG